MKVEIQSTITNQLKTSWESDHETLYHNRKEISKQDGKQPKKDIRYEFVETKDEGGNTVHYYKPKKTSEKVITKYIDVTTGKANKQEDG